MQEVYRLKNEAQAKAYLHPVRMRILQFLAQQPMTLSHVAEKLRVHPANLSHHFRKLEAADLIRLVEERDTGRVIEKYYRSSARRFELRAEEGNVTGAAARALLTLTSDLQAAVSRLPRDSTEVLCYLANGRLSKKEFEAFGRDLEKLVSKYRKVTDRNADATFPYYSLNLSIYPREPDAFPPDERP